MPAPQNAAAVGGGLRVLIVDDEKNIRTTLTVCLEGMGAEALAVGTGEAALAALARQPYDLALVDLALAGESGLDLLPKLLALEPGLAIVLITAYGTIETAVEAIRRGAWDYLAKPFTPAQIRHQVEKLRTERDLTKRVAELERRLAEEAPDVEITSRSPAMRGVLDMAARVAATDAPVLITGENGTGKSILARAVHRQSARAAKPFVVINCPTLSEELLASELFGHVKGAFTGAIRDQAGRVEVAEGGTLFLDEIGEIPPSLQSKLLRFLQEKDFERVGETRTRHGDVRIIAATNRDLDADVKAGRFREDLFYRLNVVEVRMPPLRERREDILPLARAFLSDLHRRRAASPPRDFSRRRRARWSSTTGPATCASSATPSSESPSCGPAPSSSPRRCPGACRAAPTAARRWAATSRSTRSNASTSCRCSSGSPRWRTRPRCWGSTRRRCGASARSTRGRSPCARRAGG